MPDGEPVDPSSFDPGSFRDPLSRVVVTDDRVVRVLRGDGVADFEALAASPLWQRVESDGRVVATERTELPPELAEAGWELALEHRRVPVITYPYEWTFSMLQDAALLQLDLTREALADGLLTKDATPYNVQFVGAHPVFIDVGSFERLPAGEPWRGYRQFCQLFYNPLLLQAATNVPFQPWLRGSIEGIGPDQLRALLPWRDRVRRGAFANVVLHARLERKHADSDRDVGAELQRAGYGPWLIDAQLAKLQKVVRALEWGAASSTWSDYGDRDHYGDADLTTKTEFVRDVAAALGPETVLDLGANDGWFSRVAAEHAGTVVAVDADALVVDRLYRSLRSEGNRTILPLYGDLLNPSPAQGWRTRERTTLLDRVDADLVLALALVHHLAISGTVPLPDIVAWLREYDAEVVVEFPAPTDPMVQRLLRRKRAGRFDAYTIDGFVGALAPHFDVVRRLDLAAGTRTLFHLRPR